MCIESALHAMHYVHMHLVSAAPNGLILENLFMHEKVNQLIMVDPPVPKNGFLEIPDLPGMGIDYNEENLYQYNVSGYATRMVGTERDKYVGLFEQNARFCTNCEIPAIRVDTILKPPVFLPDKNQIKQNLIDTRKDIKSAFERFRRQSSQ